jgi:hypothetical protein
VRWRRQGGTVVVDGSGSDARCAQPLVAVCSCSGKFRCLVVSLDCWCRRWVPYMLLAAINKFSVSTK